MKYQQDFIGTKAEFADFIKKTVPELFSGKLDVEGRTVVVPNDKELDYKIKYNEDEEGGSFALKVSWDNMVEEDEEELELDVD